jgi:hypothetical protein
MLFYLWVSAENAVAASVNAIDPAVPSQPHEQ